MIADEIIADVCDRLNLSSDEAKSRISRNVNSRYRRITSSIGLEVVRRAEVSKVVTIGNRTVTFTGVEKLIEVFTKSGTVNEILDQITMDQMRIATLRTQPPRQYAISDMSATTVSVYLDSSPTTAYTLYADAHVSINTLSGTAVPDFPESFHDILIFGAMADEYRKMEKIQFAHDCELDYERRLSDLRMWIAKSAYMDMYQGRYVPKRRLWS